MKGIKPTFKQKLFAKKYIENNGNATKATLEVYKVKPYNAHNLGFQVLQKPVVQEAIATLLDKKGLSLDYFNNNLMEGIEYNKEGKASQAVFADLIKFGYKLHNAVPKDNKTITKYTRKIEIAGKDYKTIEKELKELTVKTTELLQDSQ